MGVNQQSSQGKNYFEKACRKEKDLRTAGSRLCHVMGPDAAE